MLNLMKVADAIQAVCPAVGVHGDGRDRSTIVIDFLPEATEKERADAQAALEAYEEKAPIDPDKLANFLLQKGLASAQEIDALRVGAVSK